jgi:hypothetical protein
MDVLKIEGRGTGVSSADSSSSRWSNERGRVSEIPGRLAKVFMSKAFLKALTISHPRWNFVVQAVARSNGEFLVVAITDPEKSGLKARLQANFPAVIREVHGREFVTVQMTVRSEEEATDSVMDLLRRGCGVTEEDELGFIRTESGGEA